MKKNLNNGCLIVKITKTIDMKNRITFNNHTFEYIEDLNRYECRGASYFDDYHDQVPEPSLQYAAYKLESYLKDQGIKCFIEHGEKGWIEVLISLKQ